MAQDLFEIKQELVIALRNANIISTTKRGVTTQTDTGTFSTASTHTLAKEPTYVKNVRSVIVAAATLTRYTDYTVNYDTGVITFTAAQTGAYTISYDTGTTDSIFPDFPQSNLKLNAFPRISVDILGGSIEDIDLGANYTHHAYDIIVVCYGKGVEELEDMTSDVLSNMLTNKKSFYYLKYIKPSNIGPIINFPQGQNKVISRSVDFRSKFNYQ